MNITEMELLLTLDETGGFTKAAEKLGVSQPQLSRTVKMLEAELGAPVFIRLPRGIKRTKAGEIYLRYFKEILALYRTSKTQVNRLVNGQSETFSLSIHPILARNLVPKLEQHIADERNLSVQYVLQNSRKGVEDLLKGTVDIAVAADVLNYPDLVKVSLWREYIGLYSMDGRPRDTLIFNSNMIAANKIINRLKVKTLKQIDDYSLGHSLVSRGLGMGLFPNAVGESGDGLKLLRRFKQDIEISLVYRSDVIKTKGFRKIINLLRQ